MDRKTYLDKVGLPLRKFVQTRFRDLEEAAKMLKTSKTMLSQLWSDRGSRIPSKRIVTSLRQLGFDEAVLEYLNYSTKYDVEYLSYEEVKFLYLELQKVVERQDRLIRHLELQLAELKSAKLF